MRRELRVGLGILGAVAAAVIVLLLTNHRPQRLEMFVVGAVLTQDADPAKQSPIPNVDIVASDGSAVAESRSDASGFFRLTLHTGIWRSREVTLRFRHPNYHPLDISGPFGSQLCVARMAPMTGEESAEGKGSESVLANVRVRYAISTLASVTIGSMARPFEVPNAGDVPCNRQSPCSPDHKWKAATGVKSFDAGEGNQFSNVRLSCIAGPCPFTRIEANHLSAGGRKAEVSVLNWSDTTTFLFEAEVVRAMATDSIRQSYPAIFGRNMSFTLPATAQGLSIEAEMNGTAIVFPLSPTLDLSWASCEMRIAADQTRLYTCELKPGYRFK